MSLLSSARRIVVKVGSSLVTNEGRGVDAEAIANWSRQLAALANEGRELVMVSSGAIAEGMKRLGWTTRPKELHELQAAKRVSKDEPGRAPEMPRRQPVPSRSENRLGAVGAASPRPARSRPALG